MKNKVEEKVEPSFKRLIKWVIFAVVFAYASTFFHKRGIRSADIPLMVCSIWSAFIAIIEAYLIHMGQDAIDEASNNLDNKE